MTKLPKMPSAKGKGSKKKQVELPMESPTDHAGQPKPHTRTAKPSEADLIAKNRKLVTSYLEQADGLEPEIAAQVVASMGPEEINAKVREIYADAAATVADRTAGVLPSLPSPNPQPARPATPLDVPGAQEGEGAIKGAIISPEAHRDVLTIPALMSWEWVHQEGDIEERTPFIALMLEVADVSRRKSEAEKEYKTKSAALVAVLRENKTLKVAAGDLKVTVYPGKNTTINELKLIEKGVDPAVINACKVESPYWSTTFSTVKPKETKGGE